MVSVTTADIAIHGLIDIVVRRFRDLSQKSNSRHDLPRLTITALNDVEMHPSSLHGCRHFTLYALNRSDIARFNIFQPDLA